MKKKKDVYVGNGREIYIKRKIKKIEGKKGQRKKENTRENFQSFRRNSKIRKKKRRRRALKTRTYKPESKVFYLVA